jgi:hypothetical protein
VEGATLTNFRQDPNPGSAGGRKLLQTSGDGPNAYSFQVSHSGADLLLLLLLLTQVEAFMHVGMRRAPNKQRTYFRQGIRQTKVVSGGLVWDKGGLI